MSQMRQRRNAQTPELSEPLMAEVNECTNRIRYADKLGAALTHIELTCQTSNKEFSLIDIRALQRVYYDIIQGENPSFISSRVKLVLDKCEIPTVPEGVGWKVVI